MRNRIGIVALVIFGGTGCFFIGFYNQAVGNFFLDKDVLIGGLTIFGVAYYLYAQYLEKKNLKDRLYNDNNYEKIQALESQKRNRKTYHEKLDEVKKELIEEMHKLVKEVKKK